MLAGNIEHLNRVRFNIHHSFSIGFESGLCSGHFMTLMLLASNFVNKFSTTWSTIFLMKFSPRNTFKILYIKRNRFFFHNRFISFYFRVPATGTNVLHSCTEMTSHTNIPNYVHLKLGTSLDGLQLSLSGPHTFSQSIFRSTIKEFLSLNITLSHSESDLDALIRPCLKRLFILTVKRDGLTST